MEIVKQQRKSVNWVMIKHAYQLRDTLLPAGKRACLNLPYAQVNLYTPGGF